MTKEEWFKVLLEIDQHLPYADNGKCFLEDVSEELAKRGYGLERPNDEKTQQNV